MTHKQSLIAVMIGLMVFSLFIILFNLLFEKSDEQRDIGFNGDALFNPLLAAQRFLEDTGIESQSIVSMLKLKDMPKQADVLFLTGRRFDIGAKLQQKIMDWVASGGHLIIVAWPQFDYDSGIADPFLKELNITVNSDLHESNQNYNEQKIELRCNELGNKLEPPDTDAPNDIIKESALFIDSCSKNKFELVNTVIIKQRENSIVAFNPDIWLTWTDNKSYDWVINGEYGAHLLETVVEQGLITILSDYRFLTNDNLAKFDHAAFFWYLVHYSNNSGKVWIVFKGDMPPFYDWLIKYLWAPLLSILLLLIFWIWSVVPRFGAVYPMNRTARRSLIEHIRASGQFLWKNNFSLELIKQTRNTIQEKIKLSYPNWSQLTHDEYYARLASHSDISISDIERVFTASQTQSEHEFTLIIQTLEKLRKTI